MDRTLFMNVFDEVAVLGNSYSLADYDFFDSNHWFPDSGYLEICKNMQVSREDLLPSGANWTDVELTELKCQLEECRIIGKLYHWSEVDASYFARHSFGLPYMERKSFLFYFPSWMALFLCKDNQDEVSLASQHFFSRLSSLNFYEEDYFNWLNVDQRKLVVTFLNSVEGDFIEEASLAHVMWESAID